MLDYHSRFYDPLVGRFVSADTIVPDLSNPQSLNRFSYVIGNPLKYQDPTGHWYGPDQYDPAGIEWDWEAREYAEMSGDECAIRWCGGTPYEREVTTSDRVIGLAIDFTPGVGDLKGVVDAAFGEDIATGESIAPVFRILALVGLSELRHADEGVEIIRAAAPHVDEIIDVGRRLGKTEDHHWIPQEFHKVVKELYPEISRRARHYTEPLEQGFHKLVHGKWGNYADSYNPHVGQWLDANGTTSTLDEFLQFIGDLRSEYLDLYQQYQTGG